MIGSLVAGPCVCFCPFLSLAITPPALLSLSTHGYCLHTQVTRFGDENAPSDPEKTRRQRVVVHSLYIAAKGVVPCVALFCYVLRIALF